MDLLYRCRQFFLLAIVRLETVEDQLFLIIVRQRLQQTSASLGDERRFSLPNDPLQCWSAIQSVYARIRYCWRESFYLPSFELRRYADPIHDVHVFLIPVLCRWVEGARYSLSLLDWE